jgi:hypothetical protein
MDTNTVKMKTLDAQQHNTGYPQPALDNPYTKTGLPLIYNVYICNFKETFNLLYIQHERLVKLIPGFYTFGRLIVVIS